MRKISLIISIIGLLGLALGMTSCKPDYETNFEVYSLVVPYSSQKSIFFTKTGGEPHSIKVETNVPLAKWNAKSNAEWCQVQKEEGSVIVQATENTSSYTRYAEVNIAYGHQSYVIAVKQDGKKPRITFEDTDLEEGFEINIGAEDTSTEFNVKSSMIVDIVNIPDDCTWIHFKAPETKTKAGVQTIVLDIDKNIELEEREAELSVQSSDNFDYFATFTLKQSERGYIIEPNDDALEFNVKAMGETINVGFNVNSPEGEISYDYTIDAEDSDGNNWIVPAVSNAPSLMGMRPLSERFIVLANTKVAKKPRTGTIKFVSKNCTDKEPSEFTVTVNQEGFIPIPPNNVENIVATPKPGNILLAWDKPEEVNYSKIEITYYDPVFKDGKTITINDFNATSCTVKDTYKCAGEYEFTINTYGPTGMVTDSPVTIKGVSEAALERFKVKLTKDMLGANATEPNEGKLEYLVYPDTPNNNFYHTKWSSSIDTYHWITLSLQKPINKFTFDYIGRHNGNGYGDVKRAKIYGSNTGNQGDWIELGVINFDMPARRGGLGVGKDIINTSKAYSHIKFMPLARRDKDPFAGNGSEWWNMARIHLYEYNIHNEAWAQEQLNN